MCRLRPLIFFAVSQPRLSLPTVEVSLTDWESTFYVTGGGQLPLPVRIRWRSWSRMEVTTPARFHLRKNPQAPPQRGESAGRARHFAPLSTM